MLTNRKSFQNQKDFVENDPLVNDDDDDEGLASHVYVT